MDHLLIDLLGETVKDGRLEGPEGLAKLELNVASYKPLNFQAIIKTRDATRAWATFVSPDPIEALTQALDIFLRGEEARKKESTAVHHEKREHAKALVELLEMEYGDKIAATKIELEPYKGWVVVVFPKEGADLTELLPRIELRHAVAPVVRQVPSRSSRSSSATPKAPIILHQIGPAPEGGRMSVSKEILMAEWKGIYGKQPDQNIKKADLAKMLDDLEAQSHGNTLSGAHPEPELEEEVEDDLL